MIRQLRPFHSPEFFAALYGTRYDHRQAHEHILRVTHSAELLRQMEPESVADLSCGDGSLVTQAALNVRTVLGDFTPGWPIMGRIEDTIKTIDPVDVFVCSETLEHVEDPEGLLVAIRAKARRLLLSTPIGEMDDGNVDHYWGWEVADVGQILGQAGWLEATAEVYKPELGSHYTYQIWICT